MPVVDRGLHEVRIGLDLSIRLFRKSRRCLEVPDRGQCYSQDDGDDRAQHGYLFRDWPIVDAREVCPSSGRCTLGWLSHCRRRATSVLRPAVSGLFGYLRAKIPLLARAISSSEWGSAAATSHL